MQNAAGNNADLIVIFDILNGVIPLGGKAETQV